MDSESDGLVKGVITRLSFIMMDLEALERLKLDKESKEIVKEMKEKAEILRERILQEFKLDSGYFEG